jgi:cytochrome c553
MLTKKLLIAATTILMVMVGNAQAKGNAERGADLTNDCIDCHKMDGKGDFETPAIAGLSEAHLLKQLRSFYSGKRESTDNLMHMYTEERTDQDLQDLAAYWASRKK